MPRHRRAVVSALLIGSVLLASVEGIDVGTRAHICNISMITGGWATVSAPASSAPSSDTPSSVAIARRRFGRLDLEMGDNVECPAGLGGKWPGQQRQRATLGISDRNLVVFPCRGLAGRDGYSNTESGASNCPLRSFETDRPRACDLETPDNRL